MPRFVKQAYMQRLIKSVPMKKFSPPQMKEVSFPTPHTLHPTPSFKTGQETKTSYWTERGDGMLLFKADSPEAAELIIGQHPLANSSGIGY
ncbi:hypothetical protein [Microcystis aeruginosa]|uniref:Uncharacterized protein n=1 Tax=Microcystis aeruginosa NIES-3787 TaxID=2517782 RepID=A0A6H9FSY1_MICAE|nr:hypothetical protein [Microcystis aeruginosa]GCL48013.1 hypothetical protein NIES3787_37260 [Microcystis aeruginosa NIES-3787]